VIKSVFVLLIFSMVSGQAPIWEIMTIDNQPFSNEGFASFDQDSLYVNRPS